MKMILSFTVGAVLHVAVHGYQGDGNQISGPIEGYLVSPHRSHETTDCFESSTDYHGGDDGLQLPPLGRFGSHGHPNTSLTSSTSP